MAPSGVEIAGEQSWCARGAITMLPRKIARRAVVPGRRLAASGESLYNKVSGRVFPGSGAGPK